MLLKPSFVGRTELIRLYRDAILQFAAKKHTHNIWNIYAITGMGKTWLARQIFEDVEVRRACSCVWLSFEPNDTLSEDSAKLQFMPASEAIKRTLDLIPPARTGDISSSDSSSDLSPNPLPLSADLPLHPQFATLQMSWEYVPNAVPSAPLVVFLDALNILEQQLEESIGALVWKDLQEFLIKPLFEHNIFIIAISQGKLVWDWWELSTASELRSLEALVYEDVKALATQYHLGDSTGKIFQLTYGHPASITDVIRKHLEPIVLLRNQPELSIRETSDEHLEQRLVSFTPKARALLSVVGLMRYIEVEAVQFLLGLHLVPDLPSLSNQEIHSILREYQRKGLITIDARFQQTFISCLSDVRAAIFAEVSVNQPGVLIDVYEALCDFYRGRTTHVERALTEWMFYSLTLLEFETNTEAFSNPSAIKDWLRIFEYDIWQPFGNTLLRQLIHADEAIQALIKGLNIKSSVDRVINNGIFDQNKRVYQKDLEDTLFQRRFPQPISKEVAEILRMLAKGDDPGFDSEILKQQFELKYDRTLSNAQARAYMRQLNKIYATTYEFKSKRHILDRWLRQFLRNLQEVSI